MNQQHWIFISPHLDDVALSCGGLVWDLVQQGQQVEIWTLMAGFPSGDDFSDFAQQNHLAWGMSGEAAIRMRRAEDTTACGILGAHHRHFNWPDAIYRHDPATGEPIVTSNETLFGTQPEGWLVDAIAETLQQEIPGGSFVVFPLGIGGHVDHRAATRVAQSMPHKCYFYADYPYILKRPDWPDRQQKDLVKISHILNEDALQRWIKAVLSYPSQTGGFWEEEERVRLAYRNYLAGGGGRLWQKAETPEN